MGLGRDEHGDGAACGDIVAIQREPPSVYLPATWAFPQAATPTRELYTISSAKTRAPPVLEHREVLRILGERVRRRGVDSILTAEGE